MPDYIKPGIRSAYSYQPNVLECWAAVGLTLWRSRYGRQGAGNTTDELFARPGGERYQRVINYIAELNEEMGGGTELSDLPRAEAAVRHRMPQYASTPSGLPDLWADTFFRWLGCTSTALDSTVSAANLKQLIRDKAPIAIFQRNPGHLQLIVGYWEAPGQPDQPQLILFNPERYILEIVRTGDPLLPPARIREDRLLWPHWLAYYCGNLVDAKGWHY